MSNINDTVQRNYRMDRVTLAYLDAMQNRIVSNKKVTHTDLIKQAVAYYANYVLDNDDIKNVQMELLFNNFNK